MPNKQRTITREELLRIIQLCESIEKSGIDPFTVNVRELLQKLRSILESSKDLETVVLDAETLYRVALVIALQHRWLLEKASNLFVDTQIIATRILAADKRALASCLARSWRPIVSGEQLTKKMFIAGLEYFLSLPPRAGHERKLLLGAGEELQIDEEALLDRFRQRDVLESEIMNMHRELLERREEDGGLDYWSFISLEGDGRRVERAYVLAFIVSEGLAEIKRNPITGEVRIYPLESKVERSNPTSLAIAVRGREGL